MGDGGEAGEGRREALKRDARELAMDAQTLQKAANGFLARGRQTRNVHLGSCRKMDAEAARQKARGNRPQGVWIMREFINNPYESNLERVLNTFGTLQFTPQSECI